MASCSGTQGYWKVELVVNEVSTSIANNTSNAYWELWLKRTTGVSYMSGTPTIQIYVSGVKVHESSTYRSLSNIGTDGVLLESGTLYNIYHNTDGTIGNNSMSFSWTGSGFSPNNVSGSGNYPTATIPRTTDCPTLTAIIKTPTTLVISPKASNTFQHSLRIVFGGSTYWVDANGNLQTNEYKFSTNVTNIPITLPSDLYSKFTTISANGTMTLMTYKDSSKIGESSNTITVRVNEDLCRPSITSYRIGDYCNKSYSITDYRYNTIKYASRLVINFDTFYNSDSDDENTTITQVLLPDGTDITGQSSIWIIEPNTDSFTFTIKNSRGITGYTTIKNSGYLYDYTPLTFNIIELKRTEPTTGEVDITYNGNFYIGPFVPIDGISPIDPPTNQLTITWEYREKGATTWISGGTLTPTIRNDNTYSGYSTLGSNFDYQKQYEFRFTAQDLLRNSNGDGTIESPINPVIVNYEVTRGLPIIWWNDEAVHILGDVYVEGTIHNNEEV